MPTETIEISRFLPAPPLRIYDAWLDAEDHAAMTGSPATVESRQVGGRFSAGDGYIDGSHLALEPGVRIVQSWRSDDFPADALDSRLELLLAPEDDGTRLTLRHTDIPPGQGPGLLAGWEEYYLVPMERFFLAEARAARGTPRARKTRAAPARGARQAAPKARTAAAKTKRPARRASAKAKPPATKKGAKTGRPKKRSAGRSARKAGR